METLHAFRKLISPRWIALALALVSASGCAHGPRSTRTAGHDSTQTQTSPGGGPVYGPDQPFGPDLKQDRPVVLVLGPGFARGYAYAGVIRALSEAKIKIGAIYGTEMGALIGSLYAVSGSVNKLEWGVQRFREDVFDAQSSILTKLIAQNPAEKLEDALRRVFEDRDLTQTKIPLRVLVQPAGSGAKLYESGPLRAVIRAALGNMNGFPPSDLDGTPTGTASAVRAFDVSDAKSLGIGPVIAVNVLDSKEADLFPELKEADLILEPDVRAIGKTDFNKRTDAVFAGKAAVHDHLDDIRRLTGGATPHE